MPNRKSAKRPDLTDEEYRRECTVRNPAFIKDRRQLLKRLASENRLFAEPIVVARGADRGRGIEAIAEQQRKQAQFFSEAIALRNKWPGVNLDDIVGERSSATATPPKIQVAFGLRAAWPGDGSVLLRVDASTSGDEIKQQWLKIKKGLGITKNRARGEKALKIRIYDRYYHDGRTFHQIAKETGKSVSSVYGLLISTCTDIGHVRDPKQKHIDPGFDLKEHFAGCAQCISGRLCRLAEKKTGLTLPSMRELSVPDPAHRVTHTDNN